MQQVDGLPWLLFEFPDERSCPQPMVFSNPHRIIEARTLCEVRPALREVQQAVAAGSYAAGYITYEAAPAFDAALRVGAAPELPLLWFGLFAGPREYVRPALQSYSVGTWEPTLNQQTYAHNIGLIRSAIAAGRTYQLNYTLRLRASFAGDDLAFFHRLSGTQQGRYSAYLNLGRYRILSASPELFFDWQGNRLLTRPMKGTAPRGRFAAEDDAQESWLSRSVKNRAENLMIVDLLRNDLGRVAEVGTVRVPTLFEVERYPTVLQMTSTITAQTKPDTTLEDIFAALFPCGSVTGVPKASTMALIAGLENAPRGVYCGAIGLVKPGGAACFSVAIRTVTLDTAHAIVEYGVGGGITWDSTAVDEYAEVKTKAALLSSERPHFELLETLLWHERNYALLDRHMERLASSAHYFAIPLSIDQARAALDQAGREHHGSTRRVRLLVAQNGTIRVETYPLSAGQPSPGTFALAHKPVDRTNIFLFHKTTQRAVYDELRVAQPTVDEVLLWNEVGELTEFTTGNVVVELDGQCWTPPHGSGLLAGTFRAELIARGCIGERVLRPADLDAATGIWLINSVRGWVPMRRAGTATEPEQISDPGPLW